MSYRLFYAEPNASGFAFLNEEESKHAIKVLRLQAGDTIYCIDGSGLFFEGEIIDILKKGCTIKINRSIPQFGAHNYHLHIAMGITKSPDRFEWFVEKATEIGIDVISPIVCNRTEKKGISVDRLTKIALSACKQSQKAKVPQINEPVLFKDFIISISSQQKFIAHCINEKERHLLTNILKPHEDTCILIGPEGDFTENEVEISQQVNFVPVVLGSSVLRTETAGIVACQAVHQTHFKG